MPIATPSFLGDLLSTFPQFLKGAFINTPLNILEVIGSIPLNIAQSVMPEGVEVLGATEPPPKSVKERVAMAAGNLVAIPTLGLSDLAAQSITKAARKSGNIRIGPEGEEIIAPRSLDDYLTIPLDSTVEFLKEALPVNESFALLGKETSAEKRGEALTRGALKLTVLGQLLPRGPQLPISSKRNITLADLEAAKAERAALRSGVAEVPPHHSSQLRLFEETPPPATTAVPPTAQAISPPPTEPPSLKPLEEVPWRNPTSLSPSELSRVPANPELTPVEVKAIADAAAQTTILETIITKNLSLKPAERKPVNKLIGDAVREGALDPGLQRYLQNTYGLTGEGATKVIADVFEFSESRSGEKLSAISNLMSEYAAAAATGDKAALQALRRLERASKSATGNGPLTLIDHIIPAPVAKLWKAALTSQFATTARNARSGAVVGVQSLFEGLVADGAEAASVKWAGSPAPLGGFMGDTTAALSNILSQFTPEGRSSFNTIIEQMPFMRGQLKSAPHLDADTAMASRVVEATTPELSGFADRVSNLINIHNRLVENEVRGWFFGARLDANMKRLGYPNREAVLEKLKQPTGTSGERPPEQILFDQAINDAFDHAMSSSLSATPTVGFAADMVKLYAKHPWMAMVGPTFIRFLYNRYRYITDRNPANALDIFRPSVREVISDGLNQPLASKQAARTFAKGVSGIFNLATAITIRQSPWAGPKYYDLHLPGGATIDLRSEDPLKSYMALAEMLMASRDDRPINMSPAELIDEMVGVRRINDSIGFAFEDIIRSLQSDDPAVRAKAWKQPAGQVLAGFFVPLRTVEDLLAGNAMPSEAVYKDVAQDPLMAPTIANIPVAGARVLPPRIDPFTGLPQKAEHPVLRQITGFNIKLPATKFNEAIKATPGAQVGDVVGEWGNQRANSIMAEEVGKALNLPVGEGLTLGDVYADMVNAAGDPVMRKEVLKMLSGRLRELVRPQAEARDPEAFLDHRINSNPHIPPGMREMLRQLYRDVGLETGQIAPPIRP